MKPKKIAARLVMVVIVYVIAPIWFACALVGVQPWALFN
jgi:hypothetical protein